MPQHHDALVQPLGARRSHVVRREHLQHRAPRMAHQHRRERVAQHERRHDHRGEVLLQVLERAHVARGRAATPASPRRAGSTGFPARNWAWKAPITRTRWPHSPSGVSLNTAETMPAVMPMVSAITIASSASSIVTGSFSTISSVTGRWMRTDSPRSPCSTPLQPVAVAHRQRLVEVELAAQVGDDVGVALLARHRDRRVPGQQLLQPEDQDRDEEERRDDRRQAPDEEARHRLPPPSPPSSPAAGSSRRAPCGSRVTLFVKAHSQWRW